MKSAPKHPNEDQRLKALESLNILDSLPEEAYDELTLLAAKICGTPIALISLIDRDRQWFKSKQGLSVTETPREFAFCSHAILGKDIFYVPDSTKDIRFLDNPLVTGDPNVLFYAGVPIEDPNSKLPIGTLCVIDNHSRHLSEEQLQSLRMLKNQVQRLLVLKLQLSGVEKTKKEFFEMSNRQELILEGSMLGAWDWWIQENKVHYDRRWCEMLGLKKEDILQDISTWDSRLHQDDREQTYQDIKNHLDGKTDVYENIHRLKHSDGSWIWILDRGKVSEKNKDGIPIRFTRTHLDITAYKKNEILSKEIQKIANIGGWELDIETQQTKWTEQTYKIHEIPVITPTNEIMGINFYAPHERTRIKQCIEQCIQGKGFRETFEFIDAKGVKKWVESSAIPITTSSGNVKTIIGTFQDVTDKVLAAKEIELSRLKAIHTAKLASLGEMSAGIAHEINNPLAIISGSISLLPKYRTDEIKFNSKLSSIERAVTRIIKIVNGLRKFSRSSDYSQPVPTKLSSIITESLTIIDAKAKRHSTKIITDIKSDASILCDSLEIEQVIINLINNSIDAVSSQENRWVKIKLFLEEPDLVLQILDSGLGLSKDVEEKLFQPFFTTKPVGEGTGLGLSISKGILDHHKATLGLNKNLQHTCFEIRFKVYKGADGAA
jgi:PAS domain S-box-containing protein